MDIAGRTLNLLDLDISEYRFKKGGRGWKNPFKSQGLTAQVRSELKTEDQVSEDTPYFFPGFP